MSISVTTWNDKRLGELALDDGFACGELAFEGHPVSVIVEIADAESIDVATDTDLLGHDPQTLFTRALVAARNADDEEATLFVTHHLEELDADALDALLGAGVAHTADALRATLRPQALHVPDPTDEDDDEIIVDVSLGDDEVTTYLLAVAFDAGGEVISVDMES